MVDIEEEESPPGTHELDGHSHQEIGLIVHEVNERPLQDEEDGRLKPLELFSLDEKESKKDEALPANAWKGVLHS